MGSYRKALKNLVWALGESRGPCVTIIWRTAESRSAAHIKVEDKAVADKEVSGRGGSRSLSHLLSNVFYCHDSWSSTSYYSSSVFYAPCVIFCLLYPGLYDSSCILHLRTSSFHLLSSIFDLLSSILYRLSSSDFVLFTTPLTSRVYPLTSNV